ncbi:MAG: hypothetical protein DCC73_11810 [Proteobacteria bacterium]|nr:MAG: hypothetical protein DCC73_11810 [Pseudomonadota bacterium]
MKPAPVTATEMKAALTELLLVAAGFIHGRPDAAAKRRLSAAIARAVPLLKAAVIADSLDPKDAAALVARYIEADGDWSVLVEAVNDHAAIACARRYRRENATKTAEQTSVRH